MDLPITADLQGQPLAVPAVLTVDWHGSMQFDGSKATFDESVVAAAPRLQSQAETMGFALHTAKMEAQLRQPINLSDPKMDGQPQVEEIRCCGGVTMENRTFDAGRQLSAFDRLQVADLVINVLKRCNERRRSRLGQHRAPRDRQSLWERGRERGRGGRSKRARCPRSVGRLERASCSRSGTPLPARQIPTLDHWQPAAPANNVQRPGADVLWPVDNWDAMLTSENPDQLGPAARPSAAINYPSSKCSCPWAAAGRRNS